MCGGTIVVSRHQSEKPSFDEGIIRLPDQFEQNLSALLFKFASQHGWPHSES
jgi:hypothetical protein